jgi:DNA-binding MarR family transcriptional regulator
MGEIVTAFERAAHRIGGYLEPTLAEIGITQGEAHVLAQLARHGPTSIATLHHEFGHKRSTLTNIGDRLEQKRLVRRELNPSDRRSFVLHLTASGRRAAVRVTKMLDTLEREIAASVSDRDLAGLEAVSSALETISRAS